MKLTKWIIVAAVAGMTVGGMLAVASKAAEAKQLGAALGVNAGGARAGIGMRIAQRLGLTADQKQEIRAVLVADKDKLRAELLAVHEARVNLRGTIRTAGASENEIRGASAKVASAEADLAVERAALYGKIAPILTADQLAQVKQLQQQADAAVGGAIAEPGRKP